MYKQFARSRNALFKMQVLHDEIQSINAVIECIVIHQVIIAVNQAEFLIATARFYFDVQKNFHHKTVFYEIFIV